MKEASVEKTIARPGGGALLDIVELARALGESERTIRSWSQAGTIPKIVMGYRTTRYRLDDVIAALEKRSV